MRGHRVWTATVLCALSMLAAASVPTAVARTIRLPSVPTSDGASTVAVRPGHIVFGCCDPPSFGGTTRTSSRAHWSSWTQTSAVGVGAM